MIIVIARQGWDDVWEEIKEHAVNLKQETLEKQAKDKLYKFQRMRYFPVKFDDLTVDMVNPDMI